MAFPIYVLVGAYLLAAVIFALVYYAVWTVYPDTFIVHQEMNLRPSRSWRLMSARFRSGQRAAPKKLIAPPSSLEAIYEQYSKLSAEESQISEDLARVESRLPVAKKRLADLGAQHNEYVADNLRAFVEKNRLVAPPPPLPPLSEFTVTAILPELNEALAAHDQLIADFIGLSSKMDKLRTAQANLLESWEAERRNRLNFFDFAYFSLGVSTSNTFGDLIPNGRIIRFVIVFQILTSILIVGVLINSVTASSTSGARPAATSPIARPG